MQLADAVKDAIKNLQPVEKSIPLMQRILGLIDLTSLNNNDTEAGIAAFCEKAQLMFGHVAAVCVYPRFVRLVAAQFANTPVKTATVVNFPEGDASLETVLLEIGAALEDGAEEIDVVFPYARYLGGDDEYARSFIEACKAACGEKVKLKVILETGMLVDLNMIASASHVALISGADFIKTSTGKVEQGATLEAAAAMLFVIRELQPRLQRTIGIKISGGVRDIEQAAMYVELADHIMGRDWVNATTFRIGASKLVDEMIKETMV